MNDVAEAGGCASSGQLCSRCERCERRPGQRWCRGCLATARRVRRRQLSVERARPLAAQDAGVVNLDQVNAGLGGGATPERISKMTESAMSDNVLNRLRQLVATQAEQGGLTVREGHGLTRQIAQLAMLTRVVQRPGPRGRR